MVPCLRRWLPWIHSKNLTIWKLKLKKLVSPNNCWTNTMRSRKKRPCANWKRKNLSVNSKWDKFCGHPNFKSLELALKFGQPSRSTGTNSLLVFVNSDACSHCQVYKELSRSPHKKSNVRLTTLTHNVWEQRRVKLPDGKMVSYIPLPNLALKPRKCPSRQNWRNSNTLIGNTEPPPTSNASATSSEELPQIKFTVTENGVRHLATKKRRHW